MIYIRALLVALVTLGTALDVIDLAPLSELSQAGVHEAIPSLFGLVNLTANTPSSGMALSQNDPVSQSEESEGSLCLVRESVWPDAVLASRSRTGASTQLLPWQAPSPGDSAGASIRAASGTRLPTGSRSHPSTSLCRFLC